MTEVTNEELQERAKLYTDFSLATSIRQRVLIQRDARQKGFTDLADNMLKGLVPEHGEIQ